MTSEEGDVGSVDDQASGLRLYDELADWFHLLTPPADYAGEAAQIYGLLRMRVDGPLETLLELGSGGGNTASHLRARLRLTLTDISPAMLDLSRSLNPGCEHLLGDMRTLRLGRTFDAVLVHDAIMYMTDEDDLRATFATAFTHLRPGGAAVFAPDCVRETFRPATDHGGLDGDGRALRYLDWSYDPDPADTSYVIEFAILLREGDADVRVRYDRHVMGLFPRATWLGLMREAGFEPSTVVSASGRDVFVGTRPRADLSEPD
ncbi:MAG: Methyltransferase type 11 [Chloroflexi bacterium]|nr:Methyltransferase type 11 [Chloroflexota bacterium]